MATEDQTADAVARINRIVAATTSKDSIVPQDLDFLVKNASLLYDRRVTGNLTGFVQVLWDIVEGSIQQQRTGVSAPETRASRPAVVRAAMSILTRLYYPGAPRRIAPTKPDVELALRLSTRAVAGTLDPNRLTMVQSAWPLLGAVSSADPVDVLRHFKDHCWAACTTLPHAAACQLVLSYSIALKELLRMETVENRIDLVAEYVVAFAKETRFVSDVFAQTTPPLGAASAEPPALLNALARLSSSIGVALTNLITGTTPASASLLKRRFRDALRKVKSQGDFTALHLPIVATIGDCEFLVDLLLARLKVPAEAASAVTLPLLKGGPKDAPLKKILPSVDGTATILVAHALGASGLDYGAAVRSRAKQHTAEAKHFVDLYCNEVLQCPGVSAPLVIPRYSFAIPELRNVSSVLAHLVVPNKEASQALQARFIDAAGRLHNTTKQLFGSGKSELMAVATQGYHIAKALFPRITDIAIEADVPPAHAGHGGAEHDYRVAFAVQAKELLDAAALLQPVTLIYRSKMPKTAVAKGVAARDWVEALALGLALATFIFTDPMQAQRVLQSLRSATGETLNPGDIFSTEQIFYIAHVVARSNAATVTAAEHMNALWIPSAVKLSISELPMLRSAGHMLIVTVLIKQHVVSLTLFPTYINLYVGVPRSASDPDRGYGPVPIGNVKLFARSFPLVLASIEPLEASTYTKGVDGEGLAVWAVNKLSGVAAYYLGLIHPTKEDLERRRLYFCALIDVLPIGSSEVINVARAAIQQLLLTLRNPAEAALFLDYASAKIEATHQASTKRSNVEWLLDVKAALQRRQSTVRAKL